MEDATECVEEVHGRTCTNRLLFLFYGRSITKSIIHVEVSRKSKVSKSQMTIFPRQFRLKRETARTCQLHVVRRRPHKAHPWKLPKMVGWRCFLLVLGSIGLQAEDSKGRVACRLYLRNVEAIKTLQPFLESTSYGVPS